MKPSTDENKSQTTIMNMPMRDKHQRNRANLNAILAPEITHAHDHQPASTNIAPAPALP